MNEPKLDAPAGDTNFLLADPKLRLFLAGMTGLFTELAVIRWTSSHVLYLSYVTNLVLIEAFLGIGIGAVYASRVSTRAASIAAALAPLGLMLTLVCAAVFEVRVVINGPDVIYFGNDLGLKVGSSAVLVLVGLLTLSIFFSIGAAIGRDLRFLAPLVGYSAEVAGSLLGIVCFTLLSFLAVSAIVWFALAGLLMLLIGAKSRLLLYGGGVLIVATLIVVALADRDSSWTPYYRLGVSELPPAKARYAGDPTAGSPSYRIRVNSVTHQYIRDIRRREPFYEFPYRAYGAKHQGSGFPRYLSDPRAPTPKRSFVPEWQVQQLSRVLIIGAGNGTDVAFALAYGATHVDAVEIDRHLARVGRQYHPNRPFDDKRVHVTIDDGRSFLESASGVYDLIVFGLPDSLTLTSPHASVRLESFLFTKEAFARAKELLQPRRGLLVAYNYYREPWLVDRIAQTIGAGFGRMPRVIVGSDGNLSAAFFAGPGQDRVPAAMGRAWGFHARQPAPDSGKPIATDNWPFLYLKHRAVPSHLALAASAMVLTGFVLVGLLLLATRSEGKERSNVRWLDAVPFFFMGAAFLLLETAGLVRMGLLFGNTWLTNSLVFFAVLSIVLLANLMAAKYTIRRVGLVVFLLAISLAVAWFLPPATFSKLPAAARYVLSALLFFVPIFLANIFFSRTYRGSGDAALSLGANLVGAVVGGALEYVALATGYRNLFLVAGCLYLLALGSARLLSRGEGAAEPTEGLDARS